MPSENLLLTVDGYDYGGWTSVDVTLSMETASGSFSVELTERWPGQDVSRPIRPGARCSVHAGRDALITGWVDDVIVSYGPSSHAVVVSGRDVSGDLVDSSAASGEWAAVSLDRIVAAVAQPFAIRVGKSTSIGAPFDRFRIEEGETAWGAIERACKMRGVLCLSDGKGRLILSRASAGSPVAIVRGGPEGTVISASATYSDRGRYSEYRVKGQRQVDDKASPESAAHGEAIVQDGGVSRYRPRTIIAEDPGDSGSLMDRAQWEAKVARGRARTADLTVHGWRDANGDIWRPNRLVRVDCDWLRMADDMLVSSVRLRQSESGTLADLSLVHPDTFAEAPVRKRDDVGWL